MTPTPLTPRDKLHRLSDLASKTMRYWWLMLVISIVGGALSLGFATFRTKRYQSWATLFYQEQIQSQLMTPNREEVAQRNIGDRYRELLLARSQLEQILDYAKLDPFPETKDRTLEEIDELVSLSSCALSNCMSANMFNKQFEARVSARKFRKYVCTGPAAHGGGKMSGDENVGVEEHVENGKH